MGAVNLTAKAKALEVMQTYPVGEMVSYQDVAELTDFSPVTVSGVLSQLMREGHLIKGTRGMYARVEQPVKPEQARASFDLVKVRADGSRLMTDDAGELYLVKLVVI